MFKISFEDAGIIGIAWLTFPLSLTGSAMAPFPGSPVKFSGLIERVFALDNRERFPIFISSPLNSYFWAWAPAAMKSAARRKIVFFIEVKLI